MIMIINVSIIYDNITIIIYSLELHTVTLRVHWQQIESELTIRIHGDTVHALKLMVKHVQVYNQSEKLL